MTFHSRVQRSKKPLDTSATDSALPFRPLKMRRLYCFKLTGTDYPLMRDNVSEGRILSYAASKTLRVARENLIERPTASFQF